MNRFVPNKLLIIIERWLSKSNLMSPKTGVYCPIRQWYITNGPSLVEADQFYYWNLSNANYSS